MWLTETVNHFEFVGRPMVFWLESMKNYGTSDWAPVLRRLIQRECRAGARKWLQSMEPSRVPPVPAVRSDNF